MFQNLSRLVILLTNVYQIFGEFSDCCLHVSSNICERNCKKFILAPSLYNRRQKHSYLSRRLTDIVTSCPRSEISFWKCLAETKLLKDFRKEATKRHRHHTACCGEAKHLSCEVKCFTTRNVSKLQNENCYATREPKLSKCVRKAHVSRRCCRGGKNRKCKSACMQYFRNPRSKSVFQTKVELGRICGKQSKEYTCAMNQTDYTPAVKGFTECCNKGPSRGCRRTCKKLFQISEDFTEVFQVLLKHCPKLDWKVPIYKCFLETTVIAGQMTTVLQPVLSDRTAALSNDLISGRQSSFKEQCCAQAKSQQCQSWCTGAIFTPKLMGLWDAMTLACIQNPKEIKLSNCMSEILEPCEIGGTTELKFCSNFNNRPYELFRHHNSYGDSSAQKLFKYWSYSRVDILQYRLVFKDISTCEPERFKAMACLLAVKPCDHRTSQKQVCRKDCEDLLDSCLDRQGTGIDVTAKKVCAALLPKADQTDCLRISGYINKPASEGKLTDEVTLPCANNPCERGELCMINRLCDKISSCKQYTCVKGCQVNGNNNLIIPVGQLAKFSVDNKDGECYQVCKCLIWKGQAGMYFGECKEFGCHSKRNCSSNNSVFADGDVVSDNCNICTCSDGLFYCTRRICGNEYPTANVRPRRYHILPITGSPCNCENIYNPVCGLGGMTYLNSCLAKCGLMKDSQLNVGDCQSVDPCDPDPCKLNLRCIPKKSVCLSQSTHCPQYICSVRVPARYFEPSLLCRKNVSEKESDYICGYDGVTYKNKCLSEGAGTGVDYQGPCLSKKYLNSEVRTDRCSHVKCATVQKSSCKLVVPPGACCPICGSVLRLLYNEGDLCEHQEYISSNPITVAHIIKHLRQILQVSECKLYGHLTVDRDLLVLIIVNTEKSTKGQVHACKTEAERFNKSINNWSPKMKTDYYLSVLKASKINSVKWKEKTSSSILMFNRTQAYTILCITLSLIYFR